MAVTANLPIVTLTAGAAINANEAVYVTGSRTVAVTTGANELCVGVSQQTVGSGEPVSVALFGPLQKGIASAAIAAGAALQPAASGRWATRAAGTGAYAIALTAASAAADVFEFVLCPGKPA